MTTSQNSYFESGELDSLLTNLTDLAEKAKGRSLDFNAYTYFIEECRNKKYPPGTILENHHIKPKHAGGTNEPSNLISLSLRDHICAHWLLWKVYNSNKDKIAYDFRVAVPEERRDLQLALIRDHIRKCREEGSGIFNFAAQSKGGKKSTGGSANTQKQFEARQAVGRQYGHRTGKGNQKPELIEFLKKYSIWNYDGCKNAEGFFKSKQGANNCPDGFINETFYVILNPKDTFVQLAETLELFAPGSINIKNVSSMHKLIKIENNKRIYGWKLYNTLTRSEVEAGALDKLTFYMKYEDAIPE